MTPYGIEFMRLRGQAEEGEVHADVSLQAEERRLVQLGGNAASSFSKPLLSRPSASKPLSQPPAPSSAAATAARRRPWARVPDGNDWEWQDKGEFWSTLGSTATDGSAGSGEKPFLEAASTQLKMVGSVVRRYPSVAVVPLLVLGLLVGLGVFGVETAATNHEAGAQADAEAAALKVANSFSMQLDRAITPCLSLGVFVRQSPAMAALGPAFPRIAPELLAQSGSSAAIEMKLVPFGIVRAIEPPLVDLGTLGLNLFTDPTRREEALQTVQLRKVWLAGPLTVAPGGQHVLVARYPVFLPNVSADETWGNGAEGNTDCGACYDPATRTKFWGFAAVYIGFDDLTSGPSSPLRMLSSRGFRYRMAKSSPGGGGGGGAVVLAASASAPPSHAVVVPVDVPNDQWSLSVYPEKGFRPDWEGPLIAVVVVVSLALAALMFVALLNHRRLLVLLSARLPQQALKTIRRGRPFYNYFPTCTVLTANVVKYTNQANGINPLEVVKLLNELYASLDAIVEKHGLYRVETFGDSYVAVAGCPEARGKDGITWAANAAHCAREMVIATAKYRSMYGQRVQLQLGMHSGPLVAAVIDGGKRLPRYCLLGDTVSIAAQMEAASQPMAILASRDTVDLLAESGDPMVMLVPRGVVDVRGKGFVMTSWLQVDLMAGAYGGAYGGRQYSGDLAKKHRDDTDVSLDGMNVLRRTLRCSEDGSDSDGGDPLFGSFSRRMDSESWAVVQQALGLAGGGADGGTGGGTDGADGGGGGGDGGAAGPSGVGPAAQQPAVVVSLGAAAAAAAASSEFRHGNAGGAAAADGGAGTGTPASMSGTLPLWQQRPGGGGGGGSGAESYTEGSQRSGSGRGARTVPRLPPPPAVPPVPAPGGPPHGIGWGV